jgi:hypothetical protein
MAIIIRDAKGEDWAIQIYRRGFDIYFVFSARRKAISPFAEPGSYRRLHTPYAGRCSYFYHC